jgi:hypothetical protein
MKDVDTDVQAVRSIAQEGKGCGLGEGLGTRGHQGHLGSSQITGNVRIVTEDTTLSFYSLN